MELLKAQGLADDLAAAYLSSGSSQKTAPTKDLARGTIETLYRDRLVTRARPRHSWSPWATRAMRPGSSWPSDVAVVQRFLSAAVGRIHTLYVGHKISREASLSALAALDVPAETLPDLIGIWDLERAANVRVLSPAEIASAYKLSLIDQAIRPGDAPAIGLPAA
jgi:hypothetical protein